METATPIQAMSSTAIKGEISPVSPSIDEILIASEQITETCPATPRIKGIFSAAPPIRETSINVSPSNELVTALRPTLEPSSRRMTNRKVKPLSRKDTLVKIMHLESDKTSVQPLSIPMSSKRPERNRTKSPSRPCFFCSKIQTKLSRHIVTIHANLPEVAALIAYSPKKRIEALAAFKRKGILKFNQEQCAKGLPFTELARERKAKSVDLPIMCNHCQAFIGKRKFSRHKCGGNG